MKSADFNSLNAVDKVHVTMICISIAMKELNWQVPAINGSILPQNAIDWSGGDD